jgi:adenine-specific DNA-methyltransferase
MGNKNKLLDFIIPEIEKITKRGDIICDLMSGTGAIAYALKDKYTVYTNDIQYYSYIITKAIIENNKVKINKKDAIQDLEDNYKKNLKDKKYNFFENNFTDTYFSGPQCCEIDSIRYAIDQIRDEYKKDLYLTALMFSMSRCESTSGHFAQFLPKDHKRLVELRKKSVWDEMLNKCDDFDKLILTNYKNKSFNMDYKELFKLEDFKKVSCVYIDTPYTGEQYSRFYHVLETVTKYDNPKLEYKAKYRTDRFMSNFSLRSMVKNEFKEMLTCLSNENKKVVLSYSTKGLVPVDELEFIISKIFKHYKLIEKDYKHSMQGKGTISISEVLFVAYN